MKRKERKSQINFFFSYMYLDSFMLYAYIFIFKNPPLHVMYVSILVASLASTKVP